MSMSKPSLTARHLILAGVPVFVLVLILAVVLVLVLVLILVLALASPKNQLWSLPRSDYML